MRAGAAGLALLLSAHAHAATVLVTVSNVRNDHGQVLVAICTKADFLRPHCPWRGRSPAAAGAVLVRVDNVPPGIYAAEAFHDENADGVLDRNILGLPKEAMGFSNDAPMHLGPPHFDAAAFRVGQTDAAIRFALRYF